MHYLLDGEAYEGVISCRVFFPFAGSSALVFSAGVAPRVLHDHDYSQLPWVFASYAGAFAIGALVIYGLSSPPLTRARWLFIQWRRVRPSSGLAAGATICQ
jgi:hypothetical protein